MFCAFSLPKLRFATAACIFSTSELQKVLPLCTVFEVRQHTSSHQVNWEAEQATAKAKATPAKAS